jgi:hypothetical protein
LSEVWTVARRRERLRRSGEQPPLLSTRVELEGS